MGWIEFPGAVGIDGEPIDGSTDQFVASRWVAAGINGIAVGIEGGQLTTDLGGVFCNGLGCAVGGLRCVVGAVKGDLEGVCIGEISRVLDLVVDGDDLCFTSSEAVVGVVGGIKGPGAIGIDGESVDGSTDQGVSSGFRVEIAAGIE